MNLKIALGCSLVLHLTLLAIHPPKNLIPPAQALNKIEVTFEPQSFASAATSHSPALSPSKTAQGPVSSPVAQLLPAPVKSAAVVRSAEPVSQQAVAPLAVKGPTVSMVQPMVTPTLGGVSSLSEEDFSAFQHKQWVRQHLKRYLTYPTLYLEGSVRLSLTVRADGTLKEARIRDASDPRLATVALSGVQNAAPYPRFPSQMKEAEVDYDFWVQYSLQPADP